MNVTWWRVLKASLAVSAWACLFAGKLCADDWKQRFLSEGIPCLRELEELSLRLEVTTQADAPDRGLDHTYVRHCLFQGPWRLETLKTRMDRVPARWPVEVIRGVNSHYAFELQQHRHESPRTITTLEKITEKSINVGPKIFYRYSRSLFASWMLHYRSFDEWLKTQGFVIDSVEPTAALNGKTLVKLRAKHIAQKPADWIEEPNASFDAEVDLDPGNYWCICTTKYTIHLKTRNGEFSAPQQISVEYGPPIDGMPVPRIVTDITQWPAESGRDVGTTTAVYYVTDVRKTTATSESEFTLTKLGLPEINPVWQQPDESNLGYWLLAVGILAGILTIAGAWYMIQRKRALAA